MGVSESKTGRIVALSASVLGALAIGAYLFVGRDAARPAPAPSASGAAAAAGRPVSRKGARRPPPPPPRPPAPSKKLPSLEPAVAKRIATAVDRSLPCFGDVSPQSDALWVLDLAQGILDRPELAPAIEQHKRAVDSASPLGVLVDPSAPDFELPSDAEARATGPEGKLMLTILDALACRDGAAPSERVSSFVGEAHEGYLLAHQYFVIEWAERAGCEVPEEWFAQKEHFVDQVLDELRESRGFSDLFAEQLFLVSLAGRSDEIEPGWMARLLEAQGSEGCWSDPEPAEIAFGGGTFHSTQGPDHTSSLALYAIARYRFDRP